MSKIKNTLTDFKELKQNVTAYASKMVSMIVTWFSPTQNWLWENLGCTVLEFKTQESYLQILQRVRLRRHSQSMQFQCHQLKINWLKYFTAYAISLIYSNPTLIYKIILNNRGKTIVYIKYMSEYIDRRINIIINSYYRIIPFG